LIHNISSFAPSYAKVRQNVQAAALSQIFHNVLGKVKTRGAVKKGAVKNGAEKTGMCKQSNYCKACIMYLGKKNAAAP